MIKRKSSFIKSFNLPKASLLTAIVTAITASLCCIGPLVLLALGLGGAWINILTRLESLRPLGIILTFLFLSLAFWQLYIKPICCNINESCAKPKSLLFQRITFWIVVVVLLAVLSFPWYEFLFY